MKRFGLVVIILLFFIVSPVFALSIPSTHLVSVQWLTKNINNSHLVVVDVRSPKAYQSGHIPHAVNIPFYKFFQVNLTENLKFFVAPPKQIVSVFRKVGISNNNYIVFYTNNRKAKSFMFAARALWTAYYYGLNHVALLHGGIGAWAADHQSLSKKVVNKKSGAFSIKRIRLNVMATWPEIDSAYATHKFTVIDARDITYYKGLDHDKRLTRHGHVPGAIDLFIDKFSNNKGSYYGLVSPEKAKSIFEKAGVNLEKPMITYCNIGLLASGDWFVAKFLIGVKNARVYDGSMAEYSRLIDRPIIKGNKPY